MNNPTLRTLLRLLPLAFMLALSGCGGDADGSSGKAQIRVLNLSTGYESLDLYSNNGDSDTDNAEFTGVALGSISSYAALKADSYTLKLRKSGASGTLQSWSATLAEDTHATYIAYGETNAFSLLTLDEDVEEPNSGYTTLQVLNTTTSGTFDVYLTGAEDSLDDVSATFAAVAAGATGSSTNLSSGKYRLRVTAAGDKADLRLNVPEITLASEGVVSIILTETDGGVLVGAVVLPQQGQPTTYVNTDNASVRLLNVSSGYESLDLYSNNGDSDADTQHFSSIARGTISGYATLQADSYTLKFRRSGAAGNLLSLDTTRAADTHMTYVAYGATNHFAVLPLSEDESGPTTSGYTKIYVLNATSAGGLDVYLTGADDSLDDVAATVGAVPAGQASAAKTVGSGNFRLRVTGTGDKSDLRLDVSQVTLPNQGVVSIILTDTTGGTLVNAVVLPQRGEPAVFDNTTVRVRGAVGLSTGSAVTVAVAGREILTRRPARSYIGDSYLNFDAGSFPVVVYVDNVAVASGTITLKAGADYTLLIWDTAGATQLALLSDDNHITTSDKAKLRLLNGMSGLAAPLTLSVDYSPVAEYIDIGTASDYATIVPGSDYRLDVSNAQTLATLLSRTDISFKEGGIYTFFLTGDASAVVGTLRKDR